MSTKKAFRVSAYWLNYAHGPGADDGQPLATALIALADAGGDSISVTDLVLVEEIVSVAGLYTSHSAVQEDDRLWFRGYPSNVIRRGKAWLREAA
jgi:hypothetical protein